MARNHGRILASTWAPGSDFRTLDRELQGMYFFLLSQPNLNHAGLLPITLRKWAACAQGDTPESVEKALIMLHDRRYIVIDWDTEELLVRTLVRNDGIWKQPKVMLAMVGCVEEIESLTLRRVLLAELERLPLDELKDEPGERGGPSVRRQIENCIRAVRDLVPEPDGDPSPNPSGRLSDTHTDTPSGTLPDTPGEGYAEGHSEPSTRAHAGTRDARSPAPAPAPAPSPFPGPHSAAGAAGAEPAALFDAPTAVDSAPAARREPEPPELNAGTLVAEWLESRPDDRPPGQIIGRVGRALRILLDEDHIPYQVVRDGFMAWDRKGADPSAIASFVNQAQGARARGLLPGQRMSTTDQRVTDALALAAELRAEEQQAGLGSLIPVDFTAPRGLTA